MYLKMKKQFIDDNSILIEWNDIMKLGYYQQKLCKYVSVISKKTIEDITRHNKAISKDDMRAELEKLEISAFLV